MVEYEWSNTRCQGIAEARHLFQIRNCEKCYMVEEIVTCETCFLTEHICHIGYAASCRGMASRFGVAVVLPLFTVSM